jgi:hypothetical protein
MLLRCILVLVVSDALAVSRTAAKRVRRINAVLAEEGKNNDDFK